ncbi:MAG: ATPase, T2SS/T4P/T4SS family, partial [Mariprofundaceae bacterium]
MLLKQQQELIESGVVTQEQMSDALQSDEGQKGAVLLALLAINEIDADALLQTLSRIYKVPFLDISDFQPNEALLKKCPEQLCVTYKFIPIDSQGGEIIIATGDPMDFSNLDAVQFKLGVRVKPLFARPDVIQRKIREFYQGDAAFDAAMEGLNDDSGFSTESEEKEHANLDELKKGAEDSPIIKLVNGIIVQAMKMGSSDIHIEPGEKISVVRMRVDGRLRSALQFPVKAHPLVASRIKIMSKLDIANTRTPQDGRSRIKLWGKSYDMRISTLPAMHGEKVVMRILDKSGLSLNLDVLGFEKLADARVRECISRPTGAVLVTGPTGSGKTTTLYSFLHHIKDEETNLITVEDPVEFQIKGINQVQVNSKAGMTFAAALRSILRQDPDVVMVGEIRDEETASIALHAAQTGHLVLSTLHTNDAPSTITRLVEMGIDSTMLASSLNMIVAQRL